MKSAKWFVFTNLLLVLISGPFGGEAQGSDPKALADGAALLQALDRSNPLHNRAYEEVYKRLPEAAKSNNPDSPLLDSLPDRFRVVAAEDRDYIFIKKPDGTVGVAKRDRVTRGLTSTVTHLMWHKDFPGLFRQHYDELKAQHEKFVAKAKEKGGVEGFLAGKASFPSQDAPHSTLIAYSKIVWTGAQSKVMEQIDERSNEIKKEELARIARGDPQPDPKPVEIAKDEEQSAADASEPEAPDPTAKVGYDDTNLIAVFGVLQDRAQKTSRADAEAQRRCDAFGTREEQRAAIQKTIDDGVQAPQSFMDTLSVDEEHAVRLEAFEDELQLLQASAVENGEKACELSRREAPDLEAVRASSAEVDNLAETARGLLRAAQDVGADLSASLSDASSVPSVEAFGQAIEMDISAKVKDCAHPLNTLEDNADDIVAMYPPGGMTKNKETLRRAHELLQEAEAANYRHADVYRQRYSQFNSEFNNEERRERFRDCLHSSVVLPGMCSVLGSELREKKKPAVEEFKTAREDLLARRAAQLAEVSSDLGRIRRAVFEIGFAKVAAKECAATAEAKQEEPDPSLAQEAVRVADLGALMCDVADIDQRISKLRATKFANNNTAGNLLSGLLEKRAAIEAARAAFAAAGPLFDTGKTRETLDKLETAKNELSKLNGVPACPTLANKIAKGESQAVALEGVLSTAEAALGGKCGTGELKTAIEAVGVREEPNALVKIRQRLEHAKILRSLYNRAGNAHLAEKYDQALSLLLKVHDIYHAGGNDCPVLGQSIENGVPKLRDRVSERGGVLIAVKDCNESKLKSYSRSDGVVAKAMKVDILEALQVCRIKNRVREEDKENERREREQDKENERNARCESKNGAGYYPTKPNAKGTYYYVPTQSAANRWCRNHNNGAGWSAKNIKKDGRFNCTQDRQQHAAEARADCKREAKKSGKVHAFVKFNSNGTYNCQTCKRGTVYKNGRCHVSPQREANARADCKRKAKRAGKVHLFVKFNSNGSYQCHACDRGAVYKNGRCYTRRRQQQQRAKGRRYVCTITNPDGSLLGNGTTTSTIYTDRPVSGYRCRKR